MIDSYTQQFTKRPDNIGHFSVVVCSHSEHGIYQFYIPDEDFQNSIKPLLSKAWVNGFVVVIYPSSPF